MLCCCPVHSIPYVSPALCSLASEKGPKRKGEHLPPLKASPRSCFRRLCTCTPSHMVPSISKEGWEVQFLFRTPKNQVKSPEFYSYRQRREGFLGDLWSSTPCRALFICHLQSSDRVVPSPPFCYKTTLTQLCHSLPGSTVRPRVCQHWCASRQRSSRVGSEGPETRCRQLSSSGAWGQLLCQLSHWANNLTRVRAKGEDNVGKDSAQ